MRFALISRPPVSRIEASLLPRYVRARYTPPLAAIMVNDPEVMSAPAKFPVPSPSPSSSSTPPFAAIIVNDPEVISAPAKFPVPSPRFAFGSLTSLASTAGATSALDKSCSSSAWSAVTARSLIGWSDGYVCLV